MKHSVFLVAVVAAFTFGCGSDPATGVVAANANDASTSDAGGSSSDAGSTSSSFDTCEGACRQTSLTVKFDAGSGTMSRAQFGFAKNSAGKSVLHIEAHEGGSPACPTEQSPTPERTLVIEDVPIPTSDAPLSSSDGVRAAFFDFVGSILGTGVLAKATSVTVTPKAIVKNGDVIAGVAFEIDAVFPQNGTLKGKAFAEHCDSMDSK